MAEEEAKVPEENAAGGDAAAGADAAAAEGATEEKPKKKGGGFLLPLILMPVLCAGAAAGVGYMLLSKVEKVMAGALASSELKPEAEAAAGDEHAAAGDDHAAAGDDHAAAGDDHAAAADDHGGGGDHGEEAGPANPLEVDDPEELVAIVDPDDAAANHSVVVNPKGTQGKRFLVVEIYLQRSEPKDKGFKARAVKKTKLLQEIATRELEAHTVENLQKPITKEFIRRTLQKKFNGALEGKGFHTPVGKVVFSKWIMQ
jgi:flagellar basal body-associated protein FliL